MGTSDRAARHGTLFGRALRRHPRAPHRRHRPLKIVSESAVAAGRAPHRGADRRGGAPHLAEQDERPKRVAAAAQGAARGAAERARCPGRRAPEARTRARRRAAQARHGRRRRERAAPRRCARSAGSSFSARAVTGVDAEGSARRSPTKARSRSAPASSPSSASRDDGKAGIVVGVTADLTGRFNAVDLVRLGAEALGGKGGGGRPDMAQAGGPDGAQAEEALAAIAAVARRRGTSPSAAAARRRA